MLNPESGETRTETVDLKEYISILLKRKWLILVCFLLSMAGTTAFLFTRQPIYRAVAKLLIQTTGSQMPQADVTIEQNFFSTMVGIMRSQTMLRRVQQRMKKTPLEISELLKDYNVIGGAGDIMIITVDSPSRDFAREFANSLADEYLRFRDEQKAQTSESALLMLTREINRLSQELKAADERMLNYAKENNFSILESQQQVVTWQFQTVIQKMGDTAVAMADAQALRDQINQQSDVQAIVSALTVDRGQANPDAIAREAHAAATQPPLPSAGPMLQAANTGADSGKTLMQLIQPSPEDSRDTDVGKTRLWAQNEGRARSLLELETKRKRLEARLDILRRRYLSKHPLIVAAEGQLTEVVEQMEIEINLARAGVEADYLMAKRRYEQLQSMFQELNARQLAERSNYLEVQGMKEDSGRIKGLHSALLQKLLNIDVGSQFNTRTVTLLEPAIVFPEPIYPKKLRGMVIAAFMGIGVGLGLAFFIEYIDDSIKLAEDVERELQLPFLGMVPAAEWDPDDLSAHRLDKLKQQGGVAEAYRVVRSAILFSFPREKLRSLLVSSAVPREGKTTTCVNMAIGFSQIEDRVLLVDADLRRGEAHKYFGLDRAKGLAEILMGELTPEEAVRQTEVPKLDIITCGAYPSNPAELLLGWRLREFLDWAYARYSRVVFDGPPLMGIADSAILGSAVDGVMLIIWAGRTSRRYVRVAKMTAASRGAKLFGFMLNNLEPGRVGYYHYYPYYYSYYSRGYYYARHEDDQGKGGDVKGVPAPTNPEENPEKQIDDVY